MYTNVLRLVSYGASIFRKKRKEEHFVRKNHRNTAKGRLNKHPLTFELLLNPDEIIRIRYEWFDKIENDKDFQQEINARLQKPRHQNKTWEDVKNKVIESHVRDYVMKVLKKSVRKQIGLAGTAYNCEHAKYLREAKEAEFEQKYRMV